jgi:hypothetical protein
MDESSSFTPDGNRLYFISSRPVPQSPCCIRHLLHADRTGPGWSDPVMLDSPINEHFIISVSVAASGNMYLSLSNDDEPGIYKSAMPAGRHSVTLKAGELSAGVYEYVLVTKDAVLSRKMVCVK